MRITDKEIFTEESHGQVVIQTGGTTRLVVDVLGGVTTSSTFDRPQLAITTRGLISETYAPAVAAGASIPTTNAASGTGAFGLVGLRAGDVVTNLICCLNVAGTSLTFAKLALYDSNGTFLAATASASASFNSGTGYKVTALTAPYTITTSGGYYVAFLQWGSGATGATLMRASQGGVSLRKQIGSAARDACDVASLTDLNANVTLADAALAYWFGVS